MTPFENVYLGVDVGTSSARAALVTSSGKILHSVEKAIKINKPAPDFYEQSSDDIWQACCTVVKEVLNVAKVIPRGIGFDATCSLVVLNGKFEPVGISSSSDRQWNVMMWMDHRSHREAQDMTDTGSVVLRSIGGKMSPEMSAAKILWLHRNKPDIFTDTIHFMELPDFLSFKATGNITRGVNSLSCKWTYSSSGKWNKEFWDAIGMNKVVQENFQSFGGSSALFPGQPIPGGLGAQAATEFGNISLTGTSVASAVIDAYAGAIGTLGACDEAEPDLSIESLENRMALICGTSSCHIALSRRQLFAEGVWGPYENAVIAGFFAAEGGQSITGKFLDHIVSSHPAYGATKAVAQEANLSVFDHLNEQIKQLAAKHDLKFSGLLTKDLHLTPDLHGNRSPFADPKMRGVVVGWDLDVSVEGLVKTYYAGLLSLCYGTRLIIETLNQSGYAIKTLYLSGGMTVNTLFVQSLADCTNCTVVIPRERDAVLLGAATLGASAFAFSQEGHMQHHPSEGLWHCMKQMGHSGTIVRPACQNQQMFHQKKYEIFKMMCRFHREVTDMQDAS
ncbi:FGGY carbohydrate kinase domain-containing protein-like protein [Phlyctochytrium arcticum]|nr:FGGY carbohydrate kinase domain-containing protein-like protein [Phlyctochytrium arcticum]